MSRRGLPPFGGSAADVARALNEVLIGHQNVTIDVTLTANAASTNIADPRLHAGSFIGWMPRTANASAEVGAGTIRVSARGNGTATIAHANNAQVDRTFTFLIIG